MVRIGHFEAWIQVEGERLDEYGLWFDGKEVMTYILCNRRKPFEVHWVDHGSGLLTAAWIVVDGVPSSGRYIQGSGHACRTGVRCGPESEIPYTFIEAFGTIELKIAIVKDGKERPSDNPDTIKARRDKLFKEYGLDNPELPLRDVPKQNETTINVSERPGKPAESYIKFNFHYHRRQWLQQRGILTYSSPDALIAQKEAAQAQVGSPTPRPAGGASQEGHEEGPKRLSSKRISKRAEKETVVQEGDISKALLDDDDDPDYSPPKSRQCKSRSQKPRRSRKVEEETIDFGSPATVPAPAPVPATSHLPSTDPNQATSASNPRTTSPQMILRERQRAEYEAEKAKYRETSDSVPRIMMPPPTHDIQQYSGAPNTYMLPSPAPSFATASSSSYSSMPPYARPAARIIDTSRFGRQIYTTSDPSSTSYQGHVFSYASPAPPESSDAGSSSSGSTWR